MTDTQQLVLNDVPEDVLTAINDKHELMVQAYNEGDAEKIAKQFYTQDAWVVGSDDSTWKGESGIYQLYKDIVGVYQWRVDRKHIQRLAENALSEYIIGAIEPVEPGETLVYKIQFVWQKVNNEWFCSSQFFAFGTHFDEASDS